MSREPCFDAQFPATRTLAISQGNNDDRCLLCGIHRENAGFLRETCGDGYLKTGCFVIEVPAPSSHSEPA